jgi:peptide-methionine (S)-S-oxide reductase
MRIGRSAIATLSTLSTARAFSTKSPATLHKLSASSILRHGSFFISSRNPNNVSPTTSTALPMIFDRLFGGLAGGGGYNSRIDYDAIPFPMPKLAAASDEGKSLETIEKNGKTYKLATFAGGCFWGLELAFQRVPGVDYTGVGYTQGPEASPNYDAVCSGGTGHTEAVIVLYDTDDCSYELLLDTFFGRVDPSTVNGQGRDRGTQYRTGVYYHCKEQEDIAKARFALEKEKYPNRKIASECLPAQPFWPAEKYHQHYLEKGGRSNSPQSTEKGSTDTIRCYG